MGRWETMLVLVLCMLAQRAAAEVRLDWEAAEGCPDVSTVTSAVNDWLDATGTPVAEQQVTLDAEVERSAAGYELALELRTPSGVRRMPRMYSERCEVFAQAIAVQVSLLIAEADAVAPRSAAKPAPDPRQPEAERAFALRTEGLLTTSPLPVPSYGMAIVGAYVARPLRFELAFGYLFARSLRYEQHPELGGDLQTALVRVQPCAAVRLGRLDLLGCAGAEAALLRGVGVGVADARATVRGWLGVVAGAGLQVLLTPTWSVRLGVDWVTSLTRPEFYVAQLGPLYRPERFGMRGALGIEVRM